MIYLELIFFPFYFHRDLITARKWKCKWWIVLHHIKKNVNYSSEEIMSTVFLFQYSLSKDNTCATSTEAPVLTWNCLSVFNAFRSFSSRRLTSSSVTNPDQM